MSNEEREKRLAELVGLLLDDVHLQVYEAGVLQMIVRSLKKECLRLMAQAEEAQNALRQVLDVVPRPLQGNSHQFWTMYEAVEKAYETGREMVLPEGGK